MTVAVVTGGSTGIGASICSHLLDAGYYVISLSRRQPADSRCQHVEVDLLDAVATTQAAQDIARRHAITHVVHNAGAIRAALLPDVTSNDLTALTQLHLNAALTLTQAALPSMRAAGFGRIVLISSRAALGLATRTAYSATKAGMIGTFVGFENFARFERHGVDAGDPVFQPVFANLVMEPGDVARIDRHDPRPLPELARVQHRRLAQRDDGDIDDGTALVKPGVLEMADDERVVAFPFSFDGVADDFARATELHDRVRVGIMRRDAMDVDDCAGIDNVGKVGAQHVPVLGAIFIIDVALIPDTHWAFP